MRWSWAGFAALGAVLGAPAAAADVQVEQIGPRATDAVGIDQIGAAQRALGGLSFIDQIDAFAARPFAWAADSDSALMVSQAGDDVSAAITQSSGGNWISLIQAGLGKRATIVQLGSGNVVDVIQVGLVEAVSTIVQTGAANIAIVRQ